MTLAAGVLLGQPGAVVDLTTTTTSAAIAEAAGATIVAGTLFSSDGLAGSATLLGTANAVSVLGNVSAPAGLFAYAGTGTLTATGTVLASAIDIAVGTLVQTAGQIVAAGSAQLRGAQAVSIAGTIQAATAFVQAGSGGFSLTATGHLHGRSVGVSAAGPIALAAGSSLGRSDGIVDLSTTSGGVSEAAGGTIAASLLRSAGGIAGGATLLGTTNAVAELGQFAVSGGALRLADAAGLLVSGAVSAAAIDISAASLAVAASATIAAAATFAASAGSMSFAGAVSAPAGVRLTSAGDVAQTAGSIASDASFDLDVPGSFLQSGGVIRSAAGTISIAARGISAGAGIVQGADGALLSADTGGGVFLTAANRISLGGAVSAADAGAGRVALSADGKGEDAIVVDQTGGTVAAGFSYAATAARGDIRHAGTVLADAAGATISPTAGSFLQTAGLIRAAAPFAQNAPVAFRQTGGAIEARGSIVLSAPGGFVQDGTLLVPGGSVRESVPSGTLSARGSIVAATVRFDDPLGDYDIGGAISGLAPAPLQAVSQFAVTAAEFPSQSGAAGVFLATGSTNAAPRIGFSAALSATSGRGQLVATVPNDATLSLLIDSPNADAFLALQAGSAAGTIRVGSFHLSYAGAGIDAIVDLGGSVNGLTGLTATSAAFILPAQQPTYTLNGCPIMAASCIQISTQRVPVSNPLGDIQIGQNFGGLDVKYGLPDVADRDY